MAALVRRRGRRRRLLRVALIGRPPAAWRERLTAAGHQLTAGGPAAVAATAEGADVVVTALPGDGEVRRAYTELARTAAPGQVFVDLSPAAPATLSFCALALPAFLAAASTEEGVLELRGERAHYERARPVLEAAAGAALYVGPHSPLPG